MHSAAANNSRMNADKEAKQFVHIWNLLKVKNKWNDTGWLEALNVKLERVHVDWASSQLF